MLFVTKLVQRRFGRASEEEVWLPHRRVNLCRLLRLIIDAGFFCTLQERKEENVCCTCSKRTPGPVKTGHLEQGSVLLMELGTMQKLEVVG